jgi:hypothetical protein
VRGIEAEGRIGLGRVASAFDQFGLNANLTLAQSRTKIDQLGIAYSNERPLEGQSPYVGNLGISFASDRDRTQVGVLYNVFGERIRYVGYGEFPDIYEMERHSLDMTVSHGIGGYRLKLALENILDAETRFEQGGEVTESYNKGLSFGLSVSYGSR